MLATESETSPALTTARQIIATHWQPSKHPKRRFQPRFLAAGELPVLSPAEQDMLLQDLALLTTQASPAEAAALTKQRISLLSVWHRPAEAISACDMALADTPSPYAGWIMWARGYNMLQQSPHAPDEAFPWYIASLQYPDAQEDRSAYAAWAAHLEHYDEAIVLYEDLTRRQPRVADHWFGLAHCYAQLNRNDDALTAFAAGIAFDPDNRLALSNYAIVLRRVERYDQAMATSRRALARYNDYLATHADDASAWATQAHILSDLMDCDSALAACEQAETLGSVGVYRTHANILLYLGRDADALALIEHVLTDITPLDAFLLLTLWEKKSRALLKLERYDEALIAIDYALSLPPPRTFHHRADMYEARASLLAVLGRADEAMDSSDTALALEPHNMALVAMRATLLETLHRDDDVEATFTRALTAQPDAPNVEALVMWGAYLSRHDRQVEVITAFESARTQNPRALRWWDWINFGHAYAQLKRNEEALMVMQQAQALHVTYQNTFNMATVLWRLHRDDEAVAICRQALDLWNAENDAAPDNRRLWRDKPAMLFHLGQLEDALAAVAEGRQHIPDLNVASIESAILLKLERYDDVLALTTPQPDASVLVHQSRALRALGRDAEARVVLDQAVQLDPNHEDALGDLAKYGDTHAQG